MPTKPLPPEVMQAAADAYRRFGLAEGARFLGINFNTFRSRIQAARTANILTEHISERKAGRLYIDGKKDVELPDGHILVGSDAHYFPGAPSTAHRAFVKVIRDVKPAVVVLNGDIFDGASISRYPRIGWDNKPTVKQELDAVFERLGEIEDAAGAAKLYWTLGNHDSRFETFLAANAPQYEGVSGFSLKDRFSKWIPCWSVWINDDTVIKHRFKSGIHAPHNNTMWGGKTMVTGHLHSLKVSPLSDYNGTRFGVDTGTLAHPYGMQFSDYLETNPVNWRSGFALLTYWKERLLWPQLVHVLDEQAGLVEFGTTVFEV